MRLKENPWLSPVQERKLGKNERKNSDRGSAKKISESRGKGKKGAGKKKKEQKKVSEDEAIRIVENLRTKLHEELLIMLEQEQNKEIEREAVLKKVSNIYIINYFRQAGMKRSDWKKCME